MIDADLADFVKCYNPDFRKKGFILPIRYNGKNHLQGIKAKIIWKIGILTGIIS